MGQWLGRLLLATWLVIVIGVVIFNERGAEAQSKGAASLYFPIIQHEDSTLHDYMALIRFCCSEGTAEYYTVRGDGSEYGPLVKFARAGLAAWSPNGFYFVYQDHSGMWLLPLADGQPRSIPAASSVFWSPDSRYLALFTQNTLHIYEVETGTTTTFFIPTPPYLHPGAPALWSPDGTRLAWRGDLSNNRHNLWVWGGEGTAPYVAHTDQLMDSPIWSPDSQRLLFTGHTAEAVDEIYAINTIGDPATLLVRDYTLSGFVDAGTGLAMVQAGKLYLANGDGTMPTLFFSDGEINHARDVVPFRTGEWLAIKAEARYYIQGIREQTATLISSCRNDFQWQRDGNLFQCNTTNGTAIGQVTLTPPAIIQTINGNEASFLPHSSNYLAIQRYRTVMDPGYPVPAPDFVDMFYLPTNGTKKLTYPGDDEEPILEWRYMPGG